MSILSNLLSVWPRPSAYKASQLATAMPTWQVGTPTYPSRGFEPNVREGYGRNELIYACIAYKANSASQARMVVRRESNGEELEQHPLQQLIDRPNPFMTQFDLVSLTTIFLDCAGRACWEKVRSASGAVVQLWPLRPDWLHPIRDAKRFMVAYEYAVPGMNPVRIDARDVLEVKLWNPLDLYGALAPVTVASRVAAVDNSATDFIKLTFEHGGVPMGVLSSKQNLTETQVESIRTRWRQRYGGFRNWADPAVLDADATYQRAGLTFRELGFDILDARSEARICAVLDVPPILVGAKIGLDRATYSNYAEARAAFWQDGQIPRLRRIADEFTTDLAYEFGVGIEVDWDLSEVPALQEDAGVVWERAGQAYQWGGITLNEYRKIMGLDAVPDGDEFRAPAPSPFAQPTDEDTDSDGDTDEEPPDAEPGAKAMAKADTDAPDDADRRQRERALEDDMTAFFAAELERLREELRSGSA